MKAHSILDLIRSGPSLPAAGTCPTCGTRHPAEMPHSVSAPYYKYMFWRREGRFPGWEDAMAHCSEAVKTDWRRALEKGGFR